MLRAKRLAKQICSGINIPVALLFKPSQITSYISIGSQCTQTEILWLGVVKAWQCFLFLSYRCYGQVPFHPKAK